MGRAPFISVPWPLALPEPLGEFLAPLFMDLYPSQTVHEYRLNDDLPKASPFQGPLDCSPERFR